MSDSQGAPDRRASAWPAPLVALIVLTVDQVAKWFVIGQLGPDEASHRRDVLGTFLAIHYVENTGVAFGLLRDQTVLVAALAVIVLALLVRMYRNTRASSSAMTLGCGLILGGAAGNLLDRVRLGYVVDFVAVSVWPKFNIADSAITIGALLIAWTYVRQSEEPSSRRLDDSPGIRSDLALIRQDRE